MKEKTFVPELVHSLRSYSWNQFSKDLISGVIVAIIALPLSIALALASGVGPEEGIYTAIIAGFLISALGGSKVQIAGPTAAFATIVAGIVAKNGMEGMVVATVIAGVLLILMGLLRIGSLIKFIPYTITTGFTAGIAVTILLGQIKDFLGLSFPEGVKPIETVEKVRAVAASLGTLNWMALLVGAVSLAILIFWPKISKKIPGSLVAVIVGILLVKLLQLPVNTIGDLYTVKSGLPTLNLPRITFELIQQELPDGLTIAILAAIESLLSCVVADGMIGTRHNSNQELIGQGVGNIGSVLFGGIPATGAIARTAANIRSGARSPIAGIVHAVVLLLILVLLMPYASMIPMPTIAAILFQVAYNMCGWRKFVKLCKCAPKSDILILVITFLLTIFFDLVVAIEVGMIGAAVLFLKRMAEESGVRGWKYTDEGENEDTDHCEVPREVRVYEICGPLFFGSTDGISEITMKDYTKVLILRMQAVPSVDATALISLEELWEDCSRRGVTLVLSHVNEQPYRAMEKHGLVARIGADHFCANISEALAHAQELNAAAQNK